MIGKAQTLWSTSCDILPEINVTMKSCCIDWPLVLCCCKHLLKVQSSKHWNGNNQGFHSQGKMSGKWKFFQVREKSGNFVDGQGNLERTWKVREFENKWLWQTVFRKFIYSVQEGKGCTFSWDSLSPSPSALGATLKGKNLLPRGSKFFPLKVPPNWKWYS